MINGYRGNNLSAVFKLHRLTTPQPTALTCPIDGSPTWVEGYRDPLVDFELYLSSDQPETKHFWVPDPTPLEIDSYIAIFGTPMLGHREDKEYQILLQLAFRDERKSASTGDVLSYSPGLICHNASTFYGFSGGPGFHFESNDGFKFSFIHSSQHPLYKAGMQQHNHGISVNEAHFKAAYLNHVVPFLREAHKKKPLSDAHVNAIEIYIDQKL